MKNVEKVKNREIVGKLQRKLKNRKKKLKNVENVISDEKSNVEKNREKVENGEKC